MCALAVLFVLIRWFSLPLRLLYNGLVGALLLLLLNLVGESFGVAVEINIFSALVAGVFGLPGIVFLLLLGYVF